VTAAARIASATALAVLAALAPAQEGVFELEPQPSPTATPAPEASPSDVPAGATPAVTPTPDSRPAGPQKIGFVDVELVIEQSRTIRKVLDRIDEELAADARGIDALRREIRAMQLSFDEKARVVTDEERAKQRDQLLQKRGYLEERQSAFERKMKDRQARAVEPILDQVIRFISDVGARDGYDLILRGEVVLYGRSSADITERVLREIDTREAEFLRVVEAALPAAKATPTAAVPLPLIP
jgi:outer membrane protein